MGKLKIAFDKLDDAKDNFVQDVQIWQGKTKGFFELMNRYHQTLDGLTKIDNAIVNEIQDNAERSKKNWELTRARGEKLKGWYPASERTNAQQAQNKAFANCDAFKNVINECKKILNEYDTKGKDTKEKTKAAAKKLLEQAQLELAEVKLAKIEYDYQDHGGSWSEVLKAFAKVERLNAKKEADILEKLKGPLFDLDDAK